MTYHIFRDVDADKLFAIVHSESKSDHIRDNMTCPIPDFDNFFISGFRHLFELEKQFLVYIESFF